MPLMTQFGLLIYLALIALSVVLLFAQLKLFSIASDLKQIREILERAPARPQPDRDQ